MKQGFLTHGQHKKTVFLCHGQRRVGGGDCVDGVAFHIFPNRSRKAADGLCQKIARAGFVFYSYGHKWGRRHVAIGPVGDECALWTVDLSSGFSPWPCECCDSGIGFCEALGQTWESCEI